MRLDEENVIRWGLRIGASVSTPVTLALRGPLGAGKSVLARAIGVGAGVADDMPSPTYNLLFRYPAASGRQVVHLDLYRIEDPDEVWELGWEQLGADGEIIVVEWPERAGDLLPADRWDITLSVVDDQPDFRDVAVNRVGNPPELAGFPFTLSES